LTISRSTQTVITSRRNPLVKKLRLLSTRQGREEFSMILLEGTNLLIEALEKSIVQEIIATKEWIDRYGYLLEKNTNNIIFHEVSTSLLNTALTTKNPDGVASLISLNSLLPIPENPTFILALDRLQDPGNLGTLFRTSLAAEVEMIWLALGADPLSQKSIRASAGAVLSIPFERSAGEELNAIKKLANKLNDAVQRGYQVVATCPPSNSADITKPYWSIDWTLPTVLVLGNEGGGLHSILKNCCTQEITIPHSAAVESLNVASAAVPLLLERQRAKMT